MLVLYILENELSTAIRSMLINVENRQEIGGINMPNYDFDCKQCNHQFEARLSLTQKEAGVKPNCPQCQSENTVQAFRTMMFNKSTGKEPCASGPTPCGSNCEFQCHH